MLAVVFLTSYPVLKTMPSVDDAKKSLRDVIQGELILFQRSTMGHLWDVRKILIQSLKM